MSRSKPSGREAVDHEDDAIEGGWSRTKLERMDHQFTNAVAKEQRQQQAQAAAKKDNKQ